MQSLNQTLYCRNLVHFFNSCINLSLLFFCLMRMQGLSVEKLSVFFPCQAALLCQLMFMDIFQWPTIEGASSGQHMMIKVRKLGGTMSSFTTLLLQHTVSFLLAVAHCCSIREPSQCRTQGTSQIPMLPGLYIEKLKTKPFGLILLNLL